MSNSTPNQEQRTICVVFRKWRKKWGDGIIALFPYEKWSDSSYAKLCGSYEHVGQHGAAEYLTCIQRTKPATAEEYADLKAELEQIGYKLIVLQKIGQKKAGGRLVREEQQ